MTNEGPTPKRSLKFVPHAANCREIRVYFGGVNVLFGFSVNRYTYVFYKLNIPLIIVAAAPLIWYYFIRIDIHEYVYEVDPGIIFSRFACDAMALREISNYSVELYFSSYFVSMSFAFIFLIIHLLNIALDHVSVVANFERVRFPLLRSVVIMVMTTLFLFTLSTWSFTGPNGIGCSWFEGVNGRTNFDEQFFKMLFIMGVGMSSIYIGPMLTSVLLVMHVKNRNVMR